MKSRESRSAYLKKVREEREKAESLAIQFLLLCEQQGISEYTVYCLPNALEREIDAQKTRKGVNAPFHFVKP